MLPSINQFNNIEIQNGDITSGNNNNKGSKHYQDEQSSRLSEKRVRHWSPEVSEISFQETNSEDGSCASDESTPAETDSDAYNSRAGKLQRKNSTRDKQPHNNKPRANQPQGIEIKHLGKENFNRARDGIRVEVPRQLKLEVREQGRKRKSLLASVSDSEESETEYDFGSTERARVTR